MYFETRIIKSVYMKTKLLLLAVMLTSFAFAQTITTYNNATSANYVVVTSSSALNQSTTGTGLTWNFNTFTAAGTSSDAHTAPTAGELTTYPGTTTVQTTTSGATSTKVFSKDIVGEISFTGATNSDADINYNTDNALIGTFPLNYGYNFSDSTAGEIFNASVGTIPFSGGTITSQVDAYGTLNINDVGAGAYSGNVTRLKISQEINFVISGLFPGSATQTTYNYYDNSNGNLVFRYTLLNFVVTGFADETSELMEVLASVTLNNLNNSIVSQTIEVVPNPVNNVLHLTLNNVNLIKSVAISDINGRVVLQTNAFNNNLDVSQLSKGFYIVTVETENSILSKKFIKN